MAPEKIIRALLTGDAGVTALVATRIYPPASVQAPTYPALIYELISDVPSPTMTAVAGLDVYTARVQVTAYATTYAGARALADAVRLACHLQSGAIAGYQVASVLMIGRGPDDYGLEPTAHLLPLDFQVVYQQ